MPASHDKMQGLQELKGSPAGNESSSADREDLDDAYPNTCRDRNSDARTSSNAEKETCAFFVATAKAQAGC